MVLDWAPTPGGNETTDPTAAMAGALLEIGQYKGGGLWFMTDAMTGVLSGGAFGLGPQSDPARTDVSHLFLSIHIHWFQPLHEYQAHMGRFIAMVENSALQPGFDEIFVPGEIDHRREARKRAQGVSMRAEVHADLTAPGERFGRSAPWDHRAIPID